MRSQRSPRYTAVAGITTTTRSSSHSETDRPGTPASTARLSVLACEAVHGAVIVAEAMVLYEPETEALVEAAGAGV